MLSNSWWKPTFCPALHSILICFRIADPDPAEHSRSGWYVFTWTSWSCWHSFSASFTSWMALLRSADAAAKALLCATILLLDSFSFNLKSCIACLAFLSCISASTCSSESVSRAHCAVPPQRHSPLSPSPIQAKLLTSHDLLSWHFWQHASLHGKFSECPWEWNTSSPHVPRLSSTCG